MADAWYLPGGNEPGPTEGAGTWHRGSTAGGIEFRTPALDGTAAARVADRVRHAALAARRSHDIDEVVRAISRATRRLADDAASTAEYVHSIATSLGWPISLTRETLAEAGRGWTLDALHRLLDAELGNRRVMDGFAPDDDHPARARHASGPPLLFQVLAGNVPGVGVTALIRGLLVRSGVLCKSAADEPFLPALFARLLSEEEPALGRTLAVTWWPSGTEAAEWRAWGERADLVVVYGGREAVRGVRSILPAEKELLVYGPRIGIAVVLGSAVRDPEVAARLAIDACAYEQRGCVSPRLVFVVGGDARPFGELLAHSLDVETLRQPPPALSSEEAMSIRSLRAEREFEPASGATLLASQPDLRWTVIIDAEPRIEVSSLPRVVYVCAVESVGDLLTALEPLTGHIQSVGYGGDGDLSALAEGAALLGVSRVAPLGRLAWPPVDWRHDGRHQLLPLLRWTDWERD